MEIVKVGILLEDRAFAQALSIALSREDSCMRFYLLDSAAEGESCDLILAERPSSDEKVIELVRDSEAVRYTGDPPYKLYRYMESQNLINSLLFIYFKVTGKVIETKGDTSCRLVVFLGESGGCGTTSAALATACMLHRIYGSKSLYLNLCPIDDSRKYFSEEGEESLMKLLYYLDQEKEFPIGAFITEREELDFVNTGIINSYFNEMKPFLMRRFLHKIDQLGKYDFLIVDMGNHLSRENRKMLSYADCAVMLCDSQRVRPGKYRQRIAREIFKRVEAGRLLRVENFAGDMPCSQEMEIEAETLVISTQQDIDFRLEKNYGMEIGILAREIMEGGVHGDGKCRIPSGEDSKGAGADSCGKEKS